MLIANVIQWSDGHGERAKLLDDTSDMFVRLETAAKDFATYGEDYEPDAEDGSNLWERISVKAAEAAQAVKALYETAALPSNDEE